MDIDLVTDPVFVLDTLVVLHDRRRYQVIEDTRGEDFEVPLIVYVH